MNILHIKSLRNMLPMLAAVCISTALIIFASLFSTGHMVSADGGGGGGGGGGGNYGGCPNDDPTSSSYDPSGSTKGDGNGGINTASGGGTNCRVEERDRGTKYTVCDKGGGTSPPPILCVSNPNACGDTTSTYSISTGIETTTGTTCSDGSPSIFGLCSVVCNASTKTPPPNPTGYGNACTSAPNSCGKTNTGSVQCDGNCSAVTPSNALCEPTTPTPPTTPTTPTPQCIGDTGNTCQSAANSCGNRNSGVQLCDGSCSVGVPSKYTNCTITNECGIFNGVSECGGACSVGGNPNYCPDIEPSVYAAAINIAADPKLIRSGGETTVTWNLSLSEQVLARITSCEVSYGDGNNWTSTQDTRSLALYGETTFKLECTTRYDDTFTDSVTVKIIPEWQEI